MLCGARKKRQTNNRKTLPAITVVPGWYSSPPTDYYKNYS